MGGSRVFIYETVIRERHLDSFGHVNNSKYLELFEEARWEMITENGYGLHEIQAKKQGPIIFDIQIKFKRELRLREKIRIETTVTKYERKIGYIQQRILNEAGKLSCKADFRFGLFDMAARSLTVPTPEWEKALGLTDDSPDGVPGTT